MTQQTHPLGTTPKRTETCSHRHSRRTVPSGITHDSQKVETQSALTDEQIKKRWFINTMECYSAIKRKYRYLLRHG